MQCRKQVYTKPKNSTPEYKYKSESLVTSLTFNELVRTGTDFMTLKSVAYPGATIILKNKVAETVTLGLKYRIYGSRLGDTIFINAIYK